MKINRLSGKEEYLQNLSGLISGKAMECLPFTNIEYNNDYRILGLVAYNFTTFLYSENIDTKFYIDYNTSNIIFWRGDMKKKYCVEIPYNTRTEYKEMIKEILEVTTDKGPVILFINNMPVFRLSCFLVIESNVQQESVLSILDRYSLPIITSRGYDEFQEEMKYRMWDMQVLVDNDSVDNVFNYAFAFKETKELEEMNYRFLEHSRPKLFISYAHKDAPVVNQICEHMKISGLHFWKDTQELDAGDIILEQVNKAIKDSDLNIVFISNSTPTANFASFELQSIWNNIIYKKSNWFLVRIDDVDPNLIQHNLGQYLYYDFNANQDLDALMQAILKKLKKINNIKSLTPL